MAHHSPPTSTECAPNRSNAFGTDRGVIHVCHLTKYYPPAAGGIETHVRTLAVRQAAIGHRVTVICVNHHEKSKARPSDSVEEELVDGVRVIRVARRLSVSKWDYCPGLRSVLQEHADTADVLHLHTPNPTMTLALRMCRLNKPLVITHHSDVVRQRLGGILLKLVERKLMRRASTILTTSPRYAEGSEALRPFLDKVEVLPLGIETAPFVAPSSRAAAYCESLQDQYPGPLWLAVGRLVYYKGLESAVRALPHLPGTLLVIGEGPMRAAWESLASTLGVADRIIWLGKVDDDHLVGAYHAATALLFPSNARSEGFGLVQVEAMAAQCPVINTAIPHSGVSWVSPTEETGLTVPVNDAPALAAAARRLLDEPELRSQLATAARLRACSLFDAPEMARKSIELYRRVLAAAGTSRAAT